jgi:hypothetical protein
VGPGEKHSFIHHHGARHMPPIARGGSRNGTRSDGPPEDPVAQESQSVAWMAQSGSRSGPSIRLLQLLFASLRRPNAYNPVLYKVSGSQCWCSPRFPLHLTMTIHKRPNFLLILADDLGA